MLYDGKKRGGKGRPLTQGTRHGLIIHFRDEPDEKKGQGKGSAPPGGEGHRSRELRLVGQRVQLGEVAWGLRGPPQGDPAWSGE